ncbi:MAG: glycosyltransferase family 4 protein, partial [Sporichthyaceae bacterium]|nr:glycosyltransferase family 4 protein [Sporichthyaceae bacterium]
MTTVAFILVSWRPDAPAGMERAVAASAVGHAAAGHRAIIITADRAAPASYAGTPVITLDALTIPMPCGDDELRSAIDSAGQRLPDELLSIFAQHRVDVAVYVDGLWGLGRVMPTGGTTRRVLATHVVGHDIDMAAALRRAEMVIAPSPIVLQRAARRGYDTSRWRVVPNALLVDEPAPSMTRRRWLREHGPIRVLARLGPEKGVEDLLAAADGCRLVQGVEVALQAAGFEAGPGSQRHLLDACRALAERCGASIRRGLPWHQMPAWLAGASVVIVPSLAETFGLVALEAMAVGTPVVALDVDNLPSLIGAGGCVVPQGQGHVGLWRAAGKLLED